MPREMEHKWMCKGTFNRIIWEKLVMQLKSQVKQLKINATQKKSQK